MQTILIIDDDADIGNLEQEILERGLCCAARYSGTEALLLLKLSHPDLILLDRISADTTDCTESSLKTHISNLRGRLRRASG